MVSSRCIAAMAGVLLAGAAFAAPLQPLPQQPFGPMLGAAGGMHAGGQGYLGVATRTIGDPVLYPLHLKEARGACVVMVDHDSPAWKAGIREHDVVLSVNGTGVDTEEQLSHLLRDMLPGRTVQVTISRDGAMQTLSTTLADRDEIGRLAWEQHFVVPAPTDVPDNTAVPPPARTHGSGSFAHGFVSGHLLPGGTAYTGVMVDEIGPQLADYFGLKSGSGLLVHSVDANSPAATAGLHAGDVICRVNGQSVATQKEWTHALHDSKGHPVSVTVMREHHEQILTVVPDGKRRSEVEPPPANGTGERHWLAVLLVRPRIF